MYMILTELIFKDKDPRFIYEKWASSDWNYNRMSLISGNADSFCLPCMMEEKKVTPFCFVMLKDSLVFSDAFGSSSQGYSQSINNSKVRYRWSEHMALPTFKV